MDLPQFWLSSLLRFILTLFKLTLLRIQNLGCFRLGGGEVAYRQRELMVDQSTTIDPPHEYEGPLGIEGYPHATYPWETPCG